jgi:hypothetical protein
MSYIIRRSLELHYIVEYIFMLDKPFVYGLFHDFQIMLH